MKNKGKDVEIKYINPFALLREASRRSRTASDFYLRHLSGRHANIIMHLDEGRLGNVLRPDKGRGFQLLTWTFAEFPEWHRKTMVGWFPFVAVASGLVLNISQFMRFVLRLFFSLDGHNFERLGIMLLDPRGRKYHMRASYKSMIADYKCHVEVGSLKGASGTMCCGK